MADIKLFAKNENKNDDSDTNNKIIRLGYRNGICHRKICHGHNENNNMY